MISSCSSCRSSRWTSPYSGTSCSSRRRIRSVAETEGLIPSRSKCGLVARVVDAGDDLLDHVLLARDLADQHVVLVVAGHRDHHVGALDPGPLEHPELGGVAVGDVVLELLLDRQVAAAVALDHRHLVVLFEQLAGQVPAHLAGADDDDVHQPAPYGPVGLLAPRLADRALEHVDRDPRRADRVQALALVPLGPQRVEDARDHGRHLVAALGDLGDDDVGVVAVGRGDEGVGLLDPGRDQGVGLEPGADRERPPRSSQPLSRPTSSRACDSGSSSRQETSWPSCSIARATRGADPPAADDQDEHGDHHRAGV